MRPGILRAGLVAATAFALLTSPLGSAVGSPAAPATDPAAGASAGASGATAAPAAAPPASPATSVLAISVDGLNTAALTRLGPSRTPHLHAFASQGAFTANARTAHEMTITLPNHTSMVTGRSIARGSGGHGVRWNDDRLRPGTVQQAAFRPVESVFSQVDNAGGSSALFASKTKFSLWQRSWPAALDRTVIDKSNPALVATLVDDIATTPRAFRFLHLSLPDNVGHERGFMSPAYLRAVRTVDGLVGQAVAAVESSPSAATSTVLLTSDHGGARKVGHGNPRLLANYRVVFAARGAGVAAGSDLYAINPTYRDPGNRRVGYGAARQPIRNGAVANLALDLLGLPAVPGSRFDAAQDLELSTP